MQRHLAGAERRAAEQPRATPAQRVQLGEGEEHLEAPPARRPRVTIAEAVDPAPESSAAAGPSVHVRSEASSSSSAPRPPDPDRQLPEVTGNRDEDRESGPEPKRARRLPDDDTDMAYCDWLAEENEDERLMIIHSLEVEM